MVLFPESRMRGFGHLNYQNVHIGDCIDGGVKWTFDFSSIMLMEVLGAVFIGDGYVALDTDQIHLTPFSNIQLPCLI